MRKYRRPPFHAPAEPERKTPTGRRSSGAGASGEAEPRRRADHQPVEARGSRRRWSTARSSDRGPQTPSRASELGTICHAVLEHLDFKKPALPEGTGPEAAEILKGFFKSAPFKELAKSEILARELPFLIPRGDQIVQGVIDVVYRTAGSGGKVYVADYKTDKLMKPEGYALIRDVYTDAVKRVLKVDPGFKLIYLRQGRAVET